MGFDLGEAVGKILVDYDGKGVEKARDDLEELRKGTGGLGKDMKKISTGMLVAGGTIAGGLGYAANQAANFEQRLSAVAAVSGASGKDLESLRNKALQLGKDTAFSASESASAIEELVKAGLSVKDVLNGAADATVALAAAGEVDMPTAATIASNAMNQFGLSAKDMVNVADLIAGAANASAIDVGDFGQSLSQVGAVAKLSGVSFKDTAAAIALLGNAGIKGSDAGTSLKSMFSRLQPVTTKQKKLMTELGLVTADGANKFYTASGKMKSMGQVAEVLKSSLSGMTQEQKQATLQTLFGSDAIRAAAILADSGAAGFDEMAKSMGKVTAADVAATRMDNLKGRIDELSGSLETVAIGVGTALLPALTTLAEGLASAVNWFLGLGDGMQKFIAFEGAGAAALLLLGGGLIKIVSFALKLRKALIVLRTVMAATWATSLGPIAVVIAAIAAIVAIFVVLYKKNKTFKKIIDSVWGAVKAAVSKVMEWFKGLPDQFASLWGKIKSGMSKLGAVFKAVWEGIKLYFKLVWTVISTIVKVQLAVLRAIITTAINVIKAVWKTTWAAFSTVIKVVWNAITAVLRVGWNIIKTLFTTQIAIIKAVFTAVWNVMQAVVTRVWAVITTVISVGINIIKAIISRGFAVIRTIVSTVWGAIRGVITRVWNGINTVVRGAVNVVKNVVSGAWNAVKNTTTSLWNGVSDAVSRGVDKVVQKVKSIKSKVTSFFSNAGSWLKDAGKKVVQGLLDGMGAMLDKVKAKAREIAGAVAGFLPGSPVKEGPLRVLNRGYAGGQIVQMVMDGINMRISDLKTATGAAAGTIPVSVDAAAPSGSWQMRQAAAPTITSISGDLSIVDGQAYISGIAEIVYDTFSQDNDRRSDMYA